MRPRRISNSQVRDKVVELKGGLNEDVSSLALKGGELLGVQNFMIAEGSYGGYTRTKGFRRIDGTTRRSVYRVFDGEFSQSTLQAGDDAIQGGAVGTVLGITQAEQGSVSEGRCFAPQGGALITHPDYTLDVSAGFVGLVYLENIDNSDATIIGNQDGTKIVWLTYSASTKRFTLHFQLEDPITPTAISYTFDYQINIGEKIQLIFGFASGFIICGVNYIQREITTTFIDPATGNEVNTIMNCLMGASAVNGTNGYCNHKIWGLKIHEGGTSESLPIGFTAGSYTLDGTIPAMFPSDGTVVTYGSLADDFFEVRTDAYGYTSKLYIQENFSGQFVDHVEINDGGSKSFYPTTISETDDDPVVDQTYTNLAINNDLQNVAEVGGATCEGPVLAVHVFQGEVYAFRKETSANIVRMYRATAASWDHLALAPLITYNSGMSFEFVNENFYGTTGEGLPITGEEVGEKMYWVNGYNQIMSYDGDGTFEFVENYGMDNQGIYPSHITAHDNRIFVAYPGGSMQYSNLGVEYVQIGSLLPAVVSDHFSDNGGEIGIGNSITNFIPFSGNALMIFADERIFALNGNGSVNWQLERVSAQSGAYEKTAVKMLGTVYYMDDRGVTSLQAATEFGDFNTDTIDQKVKRTLEANRQNITVATPARDLNQYRLFFNNGQALYFSFSGTDFLGTTLIQFPFQVATVTEAERANGEAVIYFTTDGDEATEGYVYQMDIGTSFDGEAIEAILVTPYYHYGAPRNWKTFKKLTFEVESESAVDFQYKMYFDYDEAEYNDSIIYTKSTSPRDLDWSPQDWQSTVRGTDRIPLYINGVGTNMALVVYTSSGSADSFVIQNFITDFEVGSKQV